MAASTLLVATPDTATTPNTSGLFTPTAGRLLVAFGAASSVVGETAPTMVSSVGGFTFTRVGFGLYTTSYCLSAFIADAAAVASSQSLTFDTPNDPGTGTIIGAYEVSGMTRFGASALRQQKFNFGASGVTPNAVFDAACLTGNPTLGFFGNVTNPAGITPPTNWTEDSDTGYTTPDHGGELIHRDSGFTGTTVTWGSNSASAWGALMLELDSSPASSLLLKMMQIER